MGGVTDGRLVIVGNGTMVDIEVGTGVGKKGYVWACAAVCILEGASSSIGVNI